ncbi:MAG: tRNA (5-methylaminomethyl-2-thiouridine)(34)-methyltransferase MnmD [Salinivirgaceae bacterium]|jgi:tRNA U34 5-methylaminomethyl-2-thiouridine-forming methyltransferase MnmC|nr:tRNA (5-methylaminomethyl-2-thiouridine)(34)-methyltransferase MnmD [Salinivirgaceae bacterium]
MANNQFNRKIILTEDGSHTLYVPELDEHYHSIHGAIQESMHVFIQSGLYFIDRLNNISILEVGFGTGLNALLTLFESRKNKLNIAFTSVEKYPITLREIEQLNYRSVLKGSDDDFIKLHDVKWGEHVAIDQRFSINKLECDLVDFFPKEMYHLVYFDAFAPSLQPKLWTEDIFRRIYQSMHKNGVLVTYSAKGFVKRNLKAVGFKVTKIPGPPGKREMIRAIKS